MSSSSYVVRVESSSGLPHYPHYIAFYMPMLPPPPQSLASTMFILNAERFISIQNNIECSMQKPTRWQHHRIRDYFLFRGASNGTDFVVQLRAIFASRRFCWFFVCPYKVINCTMSLLGWVAKRATTDRSGLIGGSKKSRLKNRNAITLFWLPPLSLSLSRMLLISTPTCFSLHPLAPPHIQCKYKFYYFREMGFCCWPP